LSDQPEIVDISGLDRGDAGATRRVAAAIAAPCAEWGVFHVVGHGIPPAELARFADAMRRAVRAARAREGGAAPHARQRLGLVRRRAHQEPPRLEGGVRLRRRAHRGAPRRAQRRREPLARCAPELRDALLAHYHHGERDLARARPRAVRGLALEPDALDAAFSDHTSFQRLNRYLPAPDAAPPDAPLLPERGKLAVHHHTDAGAVTLLYQDEHAGLQVQRGERSCWSSRCRVRSP
jgi:isopenicillin N synthase-like dioxygenase